jgi:fermentation-respiration switch protein FrsA (DUF1100 family)
VWFTSGGERCHAWLYLPAATTTPPPVIVMAHGLGAVKTLRLDAFAERFAAAGYAALVFDYRYFGESEGQPRELISVRQQRQDWRAAVSFARTLPGVDGNRIVLWGTSPRPSCNAPSPTASPRYACTPRGLSQACSAPAYAISCRRSCVDRRFGSRARRGPVRPG